jgi:hypothetical protein
MIRVLLSCAAFAAAWKGGKGVRFARRSAASVS